MKHRYELVKDEINGFFIIRDYAEIDGEVLFLLCEEKYKLNYLVEEISRSSDLIDVLRTPNIYPPAEYMELIAEKVVEIIETNFNKPIEIDFDDKEILSNLNSPEYDPEEDDEEIKEESVDIEDLLDDNVDLDDNYKNLEKNNEPNEKIY